MAHVYDENVVVAPNQRFAEPSTALKPRHTARPAVTPSSTRRPALSVIGAGGGGNAAQKATPATRSKTKSVAPKSPPPRNAAIAQLRRMAPECSTEDARRRSNAVAQLELDVHSASAWLEFARVEHELLQRAGAVPAELLRRLELAQAHVAEDWTSAAYVRLQLLRAAAMDAEERRRHLSTWVHGGANHPELLVAYADAMLDTSLADDYEAWQGAVRALEAPSLDPRVEEKRAQLATRVAAYAAEVADATASRAPVKAAAAGARAEVGASKFAVKPGPRFSKLGRAVRVNKDEQKQQAAQVEHEVAQLGAMDADALSVTIKHDEDPPQPAPVDSVQSRSDERVDSRRGGRKGVRFASPKEAPAGPRAVGASLRGGSLSPLSSASSTAPPPQLRVPPARHSVGGAEDGEQTPMVATRPKVLYRSPGQPLSQHNDRTEAPTPLAANNKPRRKMAYGDDAEVAAAVAAPVAAALPAPVTAGNQRTSRARSTAAAARSHASRENPDVALHRPGDELVVGDRELVVLERIGAGGYSTVYRVLDRHTYQIFALKDVVKRIDDRADEFAFAQEVAILQRVRSSDEAVTRTLMQMEAYCETPERGQALFELGECDLGTIYDRARRYRTPGSLTIMPLYDVKHYWRQMVKCVAVLHALDIVHCDLKPANFVLFKGRVKLVDFGIAVDLHGSVKQQTKGTITLLTPEICAAVLAREASPEVERSRDIFALGCILYDFAFGRSPWGKHTHDETYTRSVMSTIANKAYEVPFPPGCDALLVKCVRLCLRHTPELRPSAAKLLEHPFLAETNE